MKAPHLIRNAAADDIKFIYNSWLKSYRDSPAVSNVPDSIYFPGQHSAIDAVLSRVDDSVKALVAFNPEDPNQILAYSVTETQGSDFIIHWVYVKHPFRQFGLAKSLVEASNSAETTRVFYTHFTANMHTTPKGINWLKKSGFKYNPYLLRT